MSIPPSDPSATNFQSEARRYIRDLQAALDQLPSFRWCFGPSKDKGRDPTVSQLTIGSQAQRLFGATAGDLRPLGVNLLPTGTRDISTINAGMRDLLQSQLANSATKSIESAGQVLGSPDPAGGVANFRQKMMAQREQVKAAVNQRLNEIYDSLTTVVVGDDGIGTIQQGLYAQGTITLHATDAIATGLNTMVATILNLSLPVDNYVSATFAPVPSLIALVK
jgi:hypothetical protein